MKSSTLLSFYKDFDIFWRESNDLPKKLSRKLLIIINAYVVDSFLKKFSLFSYL